MGGTYTGDWSGVFHGGLRQRDTYRGLAVLELGFDLEELVGLDHTRAFVQGYVQIGRDGSGDVGDIQAYSNLDAPNTAQVAEFWLEHEFGGGDLSLKIGKVDANSGFAYLEHGLEFVHSSAGFSPAIVGFPSYPDPAMSVSMRLEREGWYVAVGMFDGATAEGVPTGRRGPSTLFRSDRSNAYFYVAEAGGIWAGGRLGAGVYHHTGNFDRFDGGSENGAGGLYILFDQCIHSDPPATSEPEQGAYLLALVAMADEQVSAVAVHYMLGVRYVGAISGRQDDVLGLLVSHVDLSDVPSAGYRSDETAIELYYRMQIHDSLVLQPDLQFIRDPSGDPGIPDALIGTLRFEVSF